MNYSSLEYAFNILMYLVIFLAVYGAISLLDDFGIITLKGLM